MLLAIDTSTRQIGIALFDGARILNEATWTSPFHHTSELAPAVAQALQHGGIGAADLHAIGAAIGPGSFTALRSGLAFAKGLALTLALPILGIPSLDVTAACQPPSDLPLLVVLEAGRKRLAAGAYTWSETRWLPAGDVQLMTIEELAAGLTRPTRIAGELNDQAHTRLSQSRFAHIARPAGNLRRPAVLAELAWARFLAGERDDPDTLAPIYLSTTGIDA